VGIVAEMAGFEPARLLKWILAYSGLSAAWGLDSGHHAHAKDALAVAEIAANELEIS
jgi:streptomycin 6-kinase